jgi:hypothetical protein
MRRGAWLLVLLAGCRADGLSGSVSPPAVDDLAIAQDALAPVDATPAPDLALPLGGDTQFVFDQLFMPQWTNDWALDLDGDGTIDNRFATFLMQLRQVLDIDLTMIIENAIATGTDVLVLDLPPVSAAGQPAVIFQALLSPMPGNDPFSIDPSAMPAVFYGARLPISFDAWAPPFATVPTITLRALTPDSATVFSFPLRCHHVHVDVLATNPLRVAGSLQGSIRRVDLEDDFFVPLAMLFNYIVQPGAPGSSGQKALLLAIFDTGGANHNPCVNPDGSMGVGGDAMISACEVLQNPLVVPLLAPDIHVYDGMGRFDPQPLPAVPDSMSFGMGFTGVGAHFP